MAAQRFRSREMICLEFAPSLHCLTITLNEIAILKSCQMEENQVKYAMQRISFFKNAIRNDRLEDELCPHCFEFFGVLEPTLNSIDTIWNEEEQLRNKIKRINNALISSKLRKLMEDGTLSLYECPQCKRCYYGETTLVGNDAEIEVLSFFANATVDVPATDIYPFPISDKEYQSFLGSLIENSGLFDFTFAQVSDTLEDVITGQVLDRLARFFQLYSKEVFKNSKTIVKVYLRSHAGILETGRRMKSLPSGGDFAIWMGSLSQQESQLLDDYDKGLVNIDRVPQKVGNGVIIQAKRAETGVLEQEQTWNLINYGTLQAEDTVLNGISGKLFAEYNDRSPCIYLFPFQFTLMLKEVFTELRERITFKSAKERYGNDPATFQQFVQDFLSGRVGTPILMLRDIIGLRIPTVVFGTPPINPPKEPGPLYLAMENSLCETQERLTSLERAHRQSYTVPRPQIQTLKHRR